MASVLLISDATVVKLMLCCAKQFMGVTAKLNVDAERVPKWNFGNFRERQKATSDWNWGGVNYDKKTSAYTPFERQIKA